MIGTVTKWQENGIHGLLQKLHTKIVVFKIWFGCWGGSLKRKGNKIRFETKENKFPCSTKSQNESAWPSDNVCPPQMENYKLSIN